MITDSFLITGGCGFIGTSLIARILEINPEANIRVLDNFLTGTPDDLSEVSGFTRSQPEDCENYDGIVLIQGDIRDELVARQCAKNVSCIIHLAANTGVGPSVENPRLDMESNVAGTFNMLEAARLNNVKKFIFASSGAPAGEVEPPIHEELPPHPVSPYGASKLAGEGYCSAYYHTFGIDTICLRFGNVYGPRSKKKSSVVAKFIRQAINGETCEIYGDGTQTRDFIYIADLIEAVLLCIEKDIGGEILQIATGKERTVGETADIIAAACAKRGIEMQITHGQTRLGDVKRNFADTSKATKMIGWKVQMELNEGIEKTLESFFRSQK
jgi:UDP-glucose 4-epimerase